jgi:proline iminopeptidase
MRFRYALLVTIAAGLLAGCPSEPPERAEAPAAPPGLENGSFTANLNGFDIHYAVHGRGPVVMTVPNSWGLTLHGLRALYRPLEEHVTMVYFDPRGMGGSDPIREDSDMGMGAVRSDLDALRQHLGLDQVHAIGWSNGATNLIFLASERPDILSSAIFLHGAASVQDEDLQKLEPLHQALFERYEAMKNEMAGEEFTDRDRTTRLTELYLDDFFPAMFADPEAARTIVQDMYAQTEFSWPHSQYSNTEMPTFDLRDRLPLIPVRSLVIAGAHDMMPPETAEEISTGIPGSMFVLFENSGHFAPVEETEKFVTTVLDFLGVEKE